eukprot:TRINITY_DN81887_c0_g1_i1.p1 TRINITY_DN81887_c0_g1~~TRINITY_DN81887_c0_g1_i1.p1  ORF type:complete len:738 (-),score=57.63 TRINITY_DN81887_c0_g1_i1:6-2219(-)
MRSHIVSLLSAAALAAGSTDATLSPWRVVRDADASEASFHILVHLRQPAEGLKKLDEIFWAVSEPGSSFYGKFLCNANIAALVSPSRSAIDSVHDWLGAAGARNVELLPHNDTMRAFLPSAIVASRLLGVDETVLGVQVYAHMDSGQQIARASPAACAANLPEAVEFISGVCGVPGALHSKRRQQGARRARRKLEKRSDSACDACPLIQLVDNPPSIQWSAATRPNGDCIGPEKGSPASHECPSMYTIRVSDFESGEEIWNGEVPAKSVYCGSDNSCEMDVNPRLLGAVSNTPSLELRWSVTAMWPSGKHLTTATPVGFVASYAVMPDFLKELYNVPADLRVTHPGATQAVYEENGNFSRNDLDMFLRKTTRQESRLNVSIHGFNDEDRPDAESAMDMQLISAMAPGSATTFWNVAPTHGDGSFLQWAAEVSLEKNPPLVHSVSWGPAEDFATTAGIPGDAYVRRVNVELAKMGVRGLTLLFAAGDAGVTCNPIYGNCSMASPVWPASSPYGLGVGATFVKQTNDKSSDSRQGIQEAAMGSGIGASITTGGGFSYASPRPAHQSQAVQHYLQSLTSATTPPSDFFLSKNWSSNRALPDVSAIGSALYMVLNGSDKQAASGASASTPIVAGLVTLLNDARLNAKLPPMGPIGPFLYHAASVSPIAFHDVTVGNNRCFETPTWTSESTVNDTCCTYGFSATAGYDVVSGLGTPNFKVLRDLALSRDSFTEIGLKLALVV